MSKIPPGVPTYPASAFPPECVPPDKEDDAAYAYVDSMLSRADGRAGHAPWWYGWALRAAFKAGIKWALHSQPKETT